MDTLMHNHGLLSPSPRAPPRVKPEAQENADLDKGKRMERLINEYLQHPISSRPAPRVKPGEGHSREKLNTTKLVTDIAMYVKIQFFTIMRLTYRYMYQVIAYINNF